MNVVIEISLGSLQLARSTVSMLWPLFNGVLQGVYSKSGSYSGNSISYCGNRGPDKAEPSDLNIP